MASPHRIHTFNFEFWRGPPPQLVQSQIQSFSRPGADGTAFLNLGKRERSFQIDLVAVFNSFSGGLAAFGLYKQLPGGAPLPVVYNFQDYSASPFDHLYSIDRVDEVNIRTVPRIIGPDFDYGPGVEVTSRWILTPVAVGTLTT